MTGNQEVVSWVWVQGGALGLLLLFGFAVTVKLWNTLERKDREAREDRDKYLQALQANTMQLERMHGAVESLKAEVATIIATLATRLSRRNDD